MKKLIKLSILTLILALSVSAALYAEEAEAKAEEKETVTTGISIGLDYVSTYLWRGTYFYGGGGAFFPSVGWSIFDTGLSIGVAGEFAADYFFEGDGRDAAGFDFHSIDFGADYSVTFADLVTLNIGLWYWYYFNSEDAIGADASFLTTSVGLSFDCLLSPFIAFTYDYYVDEDFCADSENKKDFYLQFGIGHEFELYENVALSLGLAAAYYHAKSIKAYGISDIDASVGLSVTKGVATFTGGFHYVAVPTEDFYAGGDVHRWYASFGASVSL